MQFLDSIEDDASVDTLRHDASELVSFVAELNMGRFYAGQIGMLTRCPHWTAITKEDGSLTLESRAELESRDLAYRKQLRQNRDKVYSLLVELLRYQPWLQEKR
ncbi:MAG: hypothetical protein PHT49_00705 [Desulfovibrionales bacterium]|nr:hypothetical protein [Desulfovibrionales bacterium]